MFFCLWVTLIIEHEFGLGPWFDHERSPRLLPAPFDCIVASHMKQLGGFHFAPKNDQNKRLQQLWQITWYSQSKVFLHLKNLRSIVNTAVWKLTLEKNMSIWTTRPLPHQNFLAFSLPSLLTHHVCDETSALLEVDHHVIRVLLDPEIEVVSFSWLACP